MLGILGWLAGGRDAAGEIQSGGELSLDGYFASHEISGRDDFVEGNFDIDRLARTDHSLEFGSVDSGRYGDHRAVLRGELAQ